MGGPGVPCVLLDGGQELELPKQTHDAGPVTGNFIKTHTMYGKSMADVT